MHFKIQKTIAASGFLTALECTKFVFGSAPDFAVNNAEQMQQTNNKDVYNKHTYIRSIQNYTCSKT